MSDSEYMVYMYFHDNGLYAFTIDKKFKRNFEKERDMKQFIRRKMYMNDILYSAFSSKYKTKMMTEIILSSPHGTHKVTGTYEESGDLDYAVDIIDNMMIALNEEGRILSKYKLLKEEESSAFNLLSRSFVSEDTGRQIYTESTINTFRLYYRLYGYLFDPDIEIKI